MTQADMTKTAIKTDKTRKGRAGDILCMTTVSITAVVLAFICFLFAASLAAVFHANIAYDHMECDSCGAVLSCEYRAYCPDCGADISHLWFVTYGTCAECGRNYMDGSRFCTYDGAEVRPKNIRMDKEGAFAKLFMWLNKVELGGYIEVQE